MPNPRPIIDARIPIRFTGHIKIARGSERFLVTISSQKLWLIKSHFRILMQLALRRCYTQKHEIGWIHEETIIPGGIEMYSYVQRIRREFVNRGIKPYLIQSNGEHHWRLNTARWCIYFNYPILIETLDPDLKEDLLTYRIVAEERNEEKKDRLAAEKVEKMRMKAESLDAARA